MKFYIRRWFLIFSISFCSIFCWIIFTIYYNRIELLPVSNAKVSDHRSMTTVSTTQNIILRPSKLISSNSISNVDSKLKRIRNIICNINDEYKINCLKQQQSKNSSIYIPFAFIKKYFEINGRIVRTKNQEEYFEWSHSYSKVLYPDDQYSYVGKFLWFENYNVEIRDRVKCISAINGVPMSTQWFPSGHFYPTQIAQFGLSHFSKNISEPIPNTVTLIESGVLSKNILNNQAFDLNLRHDSYFETSNSTTFFVKSDLISYPIVDIDFKIKKDIVAKFYLRNRINQDEISVLYSTIERQHIVIKNKTAVYGLQSNDHSFFTLTRDLLIDLFKAGFISNRKRNNFSLVRVEFEGQIQIRSFILKTSAHDSFTIAAGDWLINNQNSNGGWDIKVKRKLSGGTLVLKEGWHSSMAQGQAMSLLTRLYAITKQNKYLDAAKKALKIFEIESYQNGVKALLFDKYIWYEEYPTVPSIYVLNGFIYSLFGLYDLSKSCDDHFCEKAQQLFDDGIQSLEAMLPLFDSGSGSFYDLRHLSLAIAPNVARWDYHSAHVNQLLYLYTIVRRDIFQITAQRWANYMKGHRAPHN